MLVASYLTRCTSAPHLNNKNNSTEDGYEGQMNSYIEAVSPVSQIFGKYCCYDRHAVGIKKRLLNLNVHLQKNIR